MEQEVASIIEAIGYHVETNRAYQNRDEAKSREIDIWAIKRVVHSESRKFQLFAGAGGVKRLHVREAWAVVMV